MRTEANQTEPKFSSTSIVRECSKLLPNEWKSWKYEEKNQWLRSKVDAFLADQKLDPARYSTIETCINRKCGKMKAPRSAKMLAELGNHLDTDVYALKFRAYPSVESNTSIIEILHKLQEEAWVAAAGQIQEAIRRNNWGRLKILTQDTSHFKDFCLLIFNKNLSKSSLKIPDSIIKSITNDLVKRFRIACSKGRASKGESKNKGYPSKTDFCDEISFPEYFNGQILSAKGSLSNSYLAIDVPGNPSNHSGPRTGKNRKIRELRRVLFKRFPGLIFDVLFHNTSDASRPFDGHAKGVRIVRKTINKKHEWYIVFSIEKKRQVHPSPNTVFAGSDFNWRKEKGKDGPISILDIGGVDFNRSSFEQDFGPNRRTRRQALGITKGIDGLPLFDPTPNGKKTCQKIMDVRKDAIKARFSMSEKSGWKSIKKLALSGTLSEADQIFIDSEIAWHEKALSWFGFMCRTMTSRKKTEYFAIARKAGQILLQNHVSDVGIPNDNYKDMAEQDRPDEMKNFERRIMNISSENRQNCSPGLLRQICKWVWTKMGIRTHIINQWKTSQRCLCGADTKSKDLHFKCSGCGKKLHRGDVAVVNGSILAKGCSVGDSHPGKCSRDGKKIKFHGFNGCDEAIEKKKADSELKRLAKAKKIALTIKDSSVSVPTAV